MSSKRKKLEVSHSKKKNKLSSQRQKSNLKDFYDLNVISSLSGSINRNHENMEENVCRINSSLEEKNQMTSTGQMNFRGELLNSDTQFKTSVLEDSMAEIFVSKNKPENVTSLNSNDLHHVNNVSESTNPEKENVVEDNSLSCPLCWKSYNEKELFLGHIKICGNKHNKSAKWLLEALQLQERQKAEREALGLPNLLHAQPNKKKASIKRTSNAKGDTNLQLALALSASMKDAEDIERLDQEQCLLELGIEDEARPQQQITLDKFCFTSSRPVLVPVNPRAKSVNKSGNYVLLKRTQADRENILSEKVTRLLAENEKVTTTLNDDNEEIIVSEYLQKFHRKDGTLWLKACDSSEHSQQDYYTHKLTDFIPPCEYAAGSRLKYIPQYSRNDEISEIKHSPKQREVTEVKVVESSSEKTPSTSSVKSSNTLTKIFINDWKCMLNKKAFSDITIFVDKGKRILAHKLIFHARCPLILKDIIKEETSKNESQDMLMWLEIPYSAALAFLEYIYCSSTDKIFTLKKSELASLRKLLQRYHTRDLLAHLKLAKSMRTRSSSISQGHRRSLEGGGYLNSESPAKKHQCSSSLASLSANSSNIDDALITTPGNEELCNNASIRSESPDLFKEEYSENFLTDSCHVKDRQSQESSRADIDFLVSLLDKSPSGEQLSLVLNKSPKSVSKQVGKINNTGFKSPYKTQKLHCTNDLQNSYRDNLEMEHSNGSWQRQSAEEKQVFSSSPKRNNTEAQISPNSTIKPCQEQDSQKTNSPLKTDCCALSSLPDSDAECSIIEIVFKSSDYSEEHLLKDSAENSHLECVSPQIIPDDSFKKHDQAEIHKMSVSEQEKDSGDQSSFLVESSLRNSSRSSSESPNYAYIKKSPPKSKTPHEGEHKLEHLNSEICIATPIKFNFDQTWKHAESTSSSTDTPKKMRVEQTQHLSSRTHNSTPIKCSVSQTCLENKRKRSESASSSTDTPEKMRGEQTQHLSRTHNSTPIKLSVSQTCLENKRKHSESASSLTDTPEKMRGEQTQHLSRTHNSTPIKFSVSQTCLENKRKHSESDSSSADTPKKMRGEQIQHLSSEAHSCTPIKFSVGQTCVENERKHSESASSSTETPKKMRGEQTDVEYCEELEAKVLDASTVSQNNTDSGLREQLDISVSKTDGVGRVTCSITFEARVARELNDQDERSNKSPKSEGKRPSDCTSDKEWDSFDEICCASPAGIFSQPLASHLKNKTPLKENKTTLSQGTPHSSHPTTVANSFIASLNESFLWREENAPEALCKTPQNTRMADDVTPPIDYNILRTAEIKKELRKYGLKPSLTKKQARTMLQYIYDQLHPWISDAEETSSSVSTQPEFKLPCNSSPSKLSCSPLTKKSKGPVKRSLLESCSQQDETDSESDSELPLSQQSFSSTSSALSEIITAEEIPSDIQDDNFTLSQEVLSGQELKIAVHRFILSNQDLHQKILLGEPFMINDLHASLKSAGFKCKMDNLMDYLDEQCITFRTLQQQGSRRRKASKNMTKKTKYIQKNKKKRSANSSLS